MLSEGSIFAGKFRVLSFLGSGGMGTVYLAEQLSTKKKRALKLMRGALGFDPEHGARFAQEARVGSLVDSDHIVEVVDAGVDAETGAPWIAMEYLEGQTLGARIASGALTMSTTYEILRQLGHGLGAAHRAGLVHRDLKPENVFLAHPRRQGVELTVKILDFGIAKLAHETGGGTLALGDGTSACGTALWMAPEQVGRNVITPAADVWAYGLIAYQMFTGRSYWRCASAGELTLAHFVTELTTDPIDPPSRRAGAFASLLPPGFDAWFARCVARDPLARFSNGEAAALELPPPPSIPATRPDPMAPTLPGFRTAPPVRRRWWIPVAIALAIPLVGAGAVTAWYASRDQEPIAPAPEPTVPRTYALDEERRCEEEEDADACVQAGVHYTDGDGVEQDYERAAEFYRRGCDAGVALGCTNLGYAHEMGLGMPEDLDAAIALYERSCEMGCPAGCALLGRQLRERDPRRALELFTRSCDGGNAEGCHELGVLYDQGVATEQDFARARELFDRACEGGWCDGCALLGYAYDEGRGAELDDARARALYERACECGSAIGCNNLAVMCDNGTAGPEDDVRARELFDRACEEEHGLACANLGHMFASGTGGPRDADRANALFMRGCRFGGYGCEDHADP